jgi:hypothetical protein
LPVELSDRRGMATAYTVTDQLNQVLQLVLVRCPDALKLRCPVVAIDVHAI